MRVDCMRGGMQDTKATAVTLSVGKCRASLSVILRSGALSHATEIDGGRVLLQSKKASFETI